MIINKTQTSGLKSVFSKYVMDKFQTEAAVANSYFTQSDVSARNVEVFHNSNTTRPRTVTVEEKDGTRWLSCSCKEPIWTGIPCRHVVFVWTRVLKLNIDSMDHLFEPRWRAPVTRVRGIRSWKEGQAQRDEVS